MAIDGGDIVFSRNFCAMKDNTDRNTDLADAVTFIITNLGLTLDENSTETSKKIIINSNKNLYITLGIPSSSNGLQSTLPEIDGSTQSINFNGTSYQYYNIFCFKSLQENISGFGIRFASNLANAQSSNWNYCYTFLINNKNNENIGLIVGNSSSSLCNYYTENTSGDNNYKIDSSYFNNTWRNSTFSNILVPYYNLKLGIPIPELWQFLSCEQSNWGGISKLYYFISQENNKYIKYLILPRYSANTNYSNTYSPLLFAIPIAET